MTDTKTKSQEIATDITALLRARNPLLWIVTREEARVESHLFEAAVAAQYLPRTWDIAQGFCDMKGDLDLAVSNGDPMNDPGDAMNIISNQTKKDKGQRGVWIMRDLPVWLSGPAGAALLRRLRNLARSLPSVERNKAQAIIVISPSRDIPAELSNHATVVEWSLPDRAEIGAILDAAVDNLPDDVKKNAAPNGTRAAAIDAAIGLSGEEAAACFARSLVQLRKIDPTLIAKEKKRVVARERVLEWYDPIPGGLDAVGGLENLKAWLVSRSSAYSPKARAYGLPAPKGALIVGVPGCGKSLIAKAIATPLNCPLLRLDLGALKSKFVGESEQNLRKAFEVIAAIGRCVVWLDEIEKALQGATSGSADGGVSSDALGAILSWMQERQGEAFVIATANDVSSLPPELLRKGRFDELWFVDLPTSTERIEIVSAALRSHGRKSDPEGSTVDVAEVAAVTEGFTGAEIAAIIPDALFTAFADGEREIETKDVVAAAATVTPLATTAKDKIERLREWGKQRARAASRPEKEEASTRPVGRVLDVA